jgi:acetolactate synthase-1/2/3 large subunit
MKGCRQQDDECDSVRREHPINFQWTLKGSSMSAEQLTGAEILVRCLAEEGVEHVFGYPGGAVLYIYDAIFKQDKFQHILVRHEQAAVHAADAYSRSSQKVGVAS